MGKNPKLLIVDDEPDQSNSLKSYFSRRNFLVFTAGIGHEALSLVKENKPVSVGTLEDIIKKILQDAYPKDVSFKGIKKKNLPIRHYGVLPMIYPM